MVGGMDRVDERSSVVDRGNDSMVSHGGNGVNSMDSMVSHGSHRMDSVVGDRVSSLVDRLRVGLALVPHVGDEAALVVRSVGHYLDAAVRESHAVLSSHHAVLVLDFLLGEVSPGVGVLHSVLVSEGSGGDLDRSVSRRVVERGAVRCVVGAVGHTDGTKLRGSQAETEASQQ